MDSSEVKLQQKNRLREHEENENNVYAELNSLPVKPSADDIYAGIYASPTASSKVVSENDGIYMSPKSVASIKEKSENQAVMFDMVDMSKLRVVLDQPVVTRKIVTPPLSNKIQHSSSTPSLSGIPSKVQLSNSKTLPEFSSAIEIPKLLHYSQRYSATYLQPEFDFISDNEEESAYIELYSFVVRQSKHSSSTMLETVEYAENHHEAQDAVGSPGYRIPAGSTEHRHSKSVDDIPSHVKTPMQKFLTKQMEAKQLKPKAQSVVTGNDVEHQNFVGLSKDKEQDDVRKPTQSSNDQETVQPNDTAYMETTGPVTSIYWDLDDDGVAQANQVLDSQQYYNNRTSSCGATMGGKSSKNKSAVKQKEDKQRTQNTKPDIMTTMKGEDGEIISVQLRKKKLPSSPNSLLSTPSSPRPISMPFADPPAPPTPKLSPPLRPGQRPLPPTPLEERNTSDVFEARGSGDGEDVGIIDRKSSMPKDPPPLPPTLVKPPPLPRTTSNYAPKLPYRPPTSALLPGNIELSTPTASPLKKSGKVPPLLPTKPKSKRLGEDNESRSEDQFGQSNDTNFLKDNSNEEKSPIPTQKLHPIAEMMLKRQSNGQSPRLSATLANSIHNETTSTTNEGSPSLNVNKQTPSSAEETIHRFSGVGAELENQSICNLSNTNTHVPQIISSLHKTPMKKPPSVLSKPTFSLSSNHQLSEHSVALKPTPPPNKPVSSKPLPSSPKPSTESLNVRSQMRALPPKVPQKPETSNNPAAPLTVAKLSSENSFSTNTQTFPSKSPPTLPKTKAIIPNATVPKKEEINDIQSLDESTGGTQVLCNRRKSGYTLHKLQAERLASVDDIDDYTTSVTCAHDDSQDNLATSQQNDPHSLKIDDDEDEENTYHSIEDPPSYLQNRKLASSVTSLVQPQPSQFNLPSSQFKTTPAVNASGIYIPSPKKSPRERILSQPSKTGTHCSPKLKPKPRPNVPPPPRPNQAERVQSSEEKQKPVPNRPPPPSAKNIEEARKRREVPKIHSERQLAIGSNQPSPSQTKNKFKLKVTNNLLQSHQMKNRQRSSPDVSSINSEEDATYSAIADASSDSISTGSDDMRLNEAYCSKALVKKKKKNLSTIASSVSTFTSKLGRSKIRTPEPLSKGAEYSLAGDDSFGDGRVAASTSECDMEEGIYAGIDDGNTTNSNENNNIYLTSLPASQQVNLREIAYAELVHGQTSDEFTS